MAMLDNSEGLIEVRIFDENTDSYLNMFLTPNEYERATNDSEYLESLAAKHYENQVAQTQQNLSLPRSSEHNLQLQEENDENQEPAASSSYIWTDGCIHLLLSLYEEYKDKFNVMRHKKVFELISNEMKKVNPNYTMSGGQCQTKLNGLKKTYKKIIDHNAKSGNDRVTWPYFDRMQEIFGACRWVNPTATASEAGPAEVSSRGTLENTNGISPSPILPKHKRKFDAIFEDYVNENKKYHKEKMELKKETANRMLRIKEDQHKEKMDVLRSLCRLMNRESGA